MPYNPTFRYQEAIFHGPADRRFHVMSVVTFILGVQQLAEITGNYLSHVCDV